MIAQENIGQNASRNNRHGFSNGDTWILDIGATHHMTANVNTLTQVNPHTGDGKLQLAMVKVWQSRILVL